MVRLQVIHTNYRQDDDDLHGDIVCLVICDVVQAVYSTHETDSQSWEKLPIAIYTI